MRRAEVLFVGRYHWPVYDDGNWGVIGSEEASCQLCQMAFFIHRYMRDYLNV